MQYPLRLIVSFVCSSLFPRLNPHSLTIGFRCTSTISRQVFVSSLKLWEPMLLVQKKKIKRLIISKHSAIKILTWICVTHAFDSGCRIG